MKLLIQPGKNWKEITIRFNYWMGGTRSDTKVKGYGFGKEYIKKDFTIQIDEPNRFNVANAIKLDSKLVVE
jgi:hypothetical protein